MPRKQRIEYPGAVYHVISRGNYRKELFLKANTGEAFERCLFEALERCGWKLHAYVIMSNHYHLALETPEPNLVEGMKWLQSTFSARFNRLREEGDPKRREELAKRYCRGWFIGEKEEMKALEKDLREKHPDVVWEGSELKELNEAMWEGLVEKVLAAAGKTEADLQSDPKGSPWKAKIARELRARTTANNPWIAKRLSMGHPSRVTNLIREHSK